MNSSENCLPCPSGEVCIKTALTSAEEDRVNVRPCPKGYYCPERTTSSN